ncbi:MAG: hypothetical protein WBO24_16580 [Nitrospirales bacterium]
MACLVKTGQLTVERSMSKLLLHEDPDIRLHAVLQLGGRANQISPHLSSSGF